MGSVVQIIINAITNANFLFIPSRPPFLLL
jgi:hypothetical protein